MTKVIHIRDAPKGWKTNSKFAYIGRSSVWDNPYIVGIHGSRKEVIALFEAKRLPELLADSNEAHYIELKDKILVCHCKPKSCHGDILANWCNDYWGVK